MAALDVGSGSLGIARLRCRWQVVRDPLAEPRFFGFHHLHQFKHGHRLVRDTSCDRWRGFQRLMLTDEIVMEEVQGYSVFVVL